MPPQNLNTLEYLIEIGLDKTKAREAEAELRRIGDEALKSAKKIDSSYREVDSSISSTTKVTKDGAATFTRLNQTLQNNAGQQKKVTNSVEQTSEGMRRLDDSARVTTRSFGGMDTSLKGLILRSAKLAARAVAVIPIWMALRGLFASVTGTFKDTAESIVQINKALQFAKNELVGFVDAEQILERVSARSKALALETGIAVSEIVEAFRLFKTAGIGVEESISGMDTAVKGALATQGDAAEIGRLLADIYNLLGDTITEVEGEADKFSFIMSTITALMPTNVININNFASALKNFAGAARVAGLNLDETLSLVAVSSTLMQRGSRAGTQLARAFSELAVRSGDVERFFRTIGSDFDARGARNFETFVQIIKDASVALEGADPEQANRLAEELASIFGLRSARVVKAFISDVSKLVEELDRLQGLSVDERMNILLQRVENATKSIEVQTLRAKQLREELGRTFIEGVTGALDFADALKTINNILQFQIDSLRVFNEIIQNIGTSILDISTLGGATRTFNRAVEEQIRSTILAQVAAGRKLTESQIDDQVKLLAKRLKEAPLGEKIQLATILGVEDDDLLRFIEGSVDRAAAKRLLQDEKILKIREKIRDVSKTLVPPEAPEDEPKVQEQIRATKEDQLALAERLAVLGFNELEIEKAKLRILIEENASTKEREAQERVITNVITDRLKLVSDALRKEFQGGISAILFNEGDLLDLGSRIGDTLKKALVSSISENLTDQILKTTGIGAIFGEAFANVRFGNSVEGRIKSGFNTGAKQTEEAIVRGFARGTGAEAIEGRGVAGFGGFRVGGLGVTLPGFGAGGFFNQPFGGTAITGGAGSAQAFARNQTLATRGQVFGALGGAALTGVSVAQQAGGGGLGVAGGVLGGLGAGALGLSQLGIGVAAGLPGLGFANISAAALGPLGIALAVGGLLLTAFSKQTQQTVEEKTTQKQIASRIDISNKSLELINRNLVAIRSRIETFPLPESAAFAEKTNLEDEFSINARR